ncbi:unnamed protein product [Caenorhabditis auriculariae]|uniref:Phosphatidylinositol-glycan biosynthesis class W protein n=1 Tax=Caenorhabditis auriculariae TaxID=2777116 RepID=A0A8S1HEG9_9PELO|nr:unnamed protein product [Caenorhabditis auriculariae]
MVLIKIPLMFVQQRRRNKTVHGIGAPMTNADVQLQGCPQHEVIIVQVLAILPLVLRNIGLPWLLHGRRCDTSRFAFWLKFLVDLVLLVLPALLAVTTWTSYLYFALISQSAFVLFVLGLVFYDACTNPNAPTLSQVLNKEIEDKHQPTRFFTYYRSLTMSLICAAILAVDFPLAFPSRFSKTRTYGHSMMDVGVAAIIFQAGVGSGLRNLVKRVPSTKPRSHWLLSPTPILFALGFGRTFVLLVLHYPHSVIEYGVHWNFFFTIAFVRVANDIIPCQFPILNAILVAAFQVVVLLGFGLEDFVLKDGENLRDNIFSANAEGISSLIGYLLIFYIGLIIGQFISTTENRVKSWAQRCGHLVLLALMFYCFQVVAEGFFGPPSRRVANLTYILSQAFGLVFAVACMVGVQLLTILLWSANILEFFNGDNMFSNLDPCLAKTLGNSGLIYFLISNILTGAVNQVIGNTHGVSKENSMLILTAYMSVSALIPHLFVYKNYKFEKPLPLVDKQSSVV